MSFTPGAEPPVMTLGRLLASGESPETALADARPGDSVTFCLDSKEHSPRSTDRNPPVTESALAQARARWGEAELLS